MKSRSPLFVAVALLGYLLVASTASANEPTLRVGAVEEGLTVHLGDTWPDGCVPALERIDVGGYEYTPGEPPPAQIDIFLRSTTGACEEKVGPKPWTLDFTFSPLYARDHEIRVFKDGEMVITGNGRPLARCQTGRGVCLHEGRFEVLADYRTSFYSEHEAIAQPLTNESAAFYFFEPTNPELLVKVLDACAVFDRFWVFTAGLTEVSTNVVVRDLWTGETWNEYSEVGRGLDPILDIDAFATCGVEPPERPPFRPTAGGRPWVVETTGQGAIQIILGNRWRDGCWPVVDDVEVADGRIDVFMSSFGGGCPQGVMAWDARIDLGGVPSGDHTVRLIYRLIGEDRAVSDEFLMYEKPLSMPVPLNDSICQRQDVACTQDGRFGVRAWYTDPDGVEHVASAGKLTADGSGFWFFRPGNLELVVKVLDGCSSSDRFWVFASGLTDLAVRLEVVDRWTSQRWEHTTNPGEPFPNIRDTTAFATCDAEAPEAN